MAESERTPGCDSPKPGGSFWQLVSPDNTFKLPEAMIFVGSAECDVLVKAKSVDKRHAVIMYDYCDKKFKVKDLNSANGTFVNEARIPVQTYIQLNTMDVLRFGFAVYQVVRVPDSREITTPKPPNELFIQEPNDILHSSTAPKNGSRTTMQEQKVHETNQQTISTDLRMSGAVSSSSLHSAFSEDSLLGVNGLSHSPSGRVPVDAVRTLGPYGPQLDTWTHSSTRKSHTAPARGTPGRSSFKASEIRASFRGKNDAAVTPPEEPTCRIVPSHSTNLSLLAKKELTKSKIVSSVSEHSISTSKSNGLRERAELSIFGSSKQKCKQKEQKEEAKVQKELPVPEVKIVAPEKKQKIAGEGKLKIEDVAPLSPVPRTRKFEGAAASVTTELPTPSEDASTPTSSGSTEPASSGKPSTSSSPTTSSHKPSGDDSTITASDAAQPPSSAASSPEKQPPPPSPNNYPLAFTIDFDDGKKLEINDKLSKFAPRHIRNLSMSRQEEVKQALKQDRGGKAEVEAPKGKPSPPALSPTAPPVVVPLLRRAGYHSEGYFSSDQDEDLSTKSDLTALKKSQDKILKPSALTQDKKSKPVSSLALESNACSSSKKVVAAVAGDRRTVTLEESALQHFAKILAEKPSNSMASPEREWADSPDDNGSETGTYTIDKDSPSPEEEKARSDIDAVFGVNGEDKASYDARTFTRNKEARNGHEEQGAMSSSYRSSPNWIKEWAAQVAEQHNNQPLSPPTESVLPPIKIKGRAPSPAAAAKPSSRASPAPPSRNWAPPPVEPSAAGKGRYKLPSLSSPVASDFSDPSDNSPLHRRNVERSIDNETQSYLRATESVMSAMQARMTSQTQDNADSEEESALTAGAVTAKSLTAQLRAKLKALEEKSVRSKHHAAIAAAASPSPPPVAPGPSAAPAKRLLGSKSKEERQSDSSSDAGDHKPRSRERSDSVGPQTRYNRAFSLRRARLEADEAKTKPTQPPVKPTPVKPTPTAASKLKKEAPKTVSKPPLSSSNFQRTDGGRFSLRAGKVNNQVTPPPPASKAKPPAAGAKKEPAKKTSSSGSGNRSNSNLCSKELEFQNWKRRKNYDPMKAAMEGKKKEAAAKKVVPGQGADVMTQSAIVMHSSPNSSPMTSILRSASFHGTGAMASMNSSHNSNATSEDEATLSADEDLAERSNNSVSPRHMRLPPSPLRALSQPPDHLSPRKKSLDETMQGGSSMSFVRNTTPTSSVRSRGKFEALDNLVIAAIHGFSNKIKGSSHNVLGKLRVLFQEDQDKVLMLEDALNLLEESEPATSSPNKSPSKELSGTLRNLKKLEHVFNVLDEVLFGDEELELRDEEEDLSDLEEA